MITNGDKTITRQRPNEKKMRQDKTRQTHDKDEDKDNKDMTRQH